MDKNALLSDFEDFIRKEKEKNTLEFKKASNQIPTSLWETYSSFCNTEGGTIILGVAEGKGESENEIVGVQDAGKLVTDFWSTVTNKSKVSHCSLTNNDVTIIP